VCTFSPLESSQKFTKVHKSSQKFTKVHKSTLEVHKSSQKFTKIHKFHKSSHFQKCWEICIWICLVFGLLFLLTSPNRYYPALLKVHKSSHFQKCWVIFITICLVFVILSEVFSKIWDFPKIWDFVIIFGCYSKSILPSTSEKVHKSSQKFTFSEVLGNL
jgi:hypothetical protein